jgi:AmmeMemoRadiSam system protein B
MAKNDREGPALRAATVEGIFYPAEPAALGARVAALLAEASTGLPQPGGPVYALITPHAALDYAGAVTAAAYCSVADRRPAVAVLLGPMHRDASNGVVLPESASFQTPLGNVPVDRQILEELQDAGEARSWFRWDDIPHLEEHCLEVQLPFLKHLFPSVRIVPLLVGKPSLRLVEALAGRLWEVFSGRLAETLFVATANLGGGPTGRRSDACRQRLIQRVLRSDWRGITEQAARRRPCSCGVGPIAAILHLHRRRGGPVTVLREGSSRDSGTDPRHAVHYAAIALAE